MENIKHLAYGSGPLGSSGFGGESESSASCPTVLKYSGDMLTLEATPRDAIGPYYVEFRIRGTEIPGTDPLNRPYTISSAPENVTLVRTYTISDEDVVLASEGTITFSVYVEDSCPMGHQSSTESCTIDIGCYSPVCNFTVT